MVDGSESVVEGVILPFYAPRRPVDAHALAFRHGTCRKMGSEREEDGFGVGKGFKNMSSLSHSSKKKKNFNDSRPPADYWTFSHTNNLSRGII